MVALLLCSALLGCAEESSGGRGAAPAISLPEFKARILEAGLFSGGPDAWFEEAGRETLATSIRVGLMPHHRVLDIGAGSLRVAWWFLHFVEPANYHAIEPVRSRIDAAADILGADIHIPLPFDFGLARPIHRIPR
jgi:hypothetical protein